MNQNTASAKDYVDNNSTTAAPSLQSLYNPPRPRGEVGWICPVCGRGLAPSTAYCPCNLTRNITYLNGGTYIQDIMDGAVNTNTTPPEAYYTTTATTATNKCHDGTIYGAHFDTHN